MARIRSIKPEFWASESLGTRLRGPDGRQARLLFIALWNHAEDHGVCRAAPALLRAAAFPYDEDVTGADVARWLGMLEAGGFIVRYERNGSSYLWIRAFDEHQRIDRKSKTTLPEPSNDEIEGRASPQRAVVHHIQTSAEPSRVTVEPENKNDFPDSSPRRALDEPSLQEGKGGGVEGSGSFPAAQGYVGVEEHPAGRPAFALTAQDASPPSRPPKPPKAPKPPPEPSGDPRHQPLVDELVGVFREKTGKGYGFLPIDARKVKDLLTLADQDPETRGERAPAEIARRWGIGLDWAWPNGQQPVQSLTALVQRWNECRELRTAAGTKRFVDASTANHPKEAGDVVF